MLVSRSAAESFSVARRASGVGASNSLIPTTVDACLFCIAG